MRRGHCHGRAVRKLGSVITGEFLAQKGSEEEEKEAILSFPLPERQGWVNDCLFGLALCHILN